MRKRVVITGLGCISPLGNDIQSLWDNVLAGKSGVGAITHYDASNFKTRFAAEVKGFDGAALFGNREARRMDRFAQFAVAAALQALQDSGLEVNDQNRDRIGVLIGTGIGGIGTLFEQMQVYTRAWPEQSQPFHRPDDAARFRRLHDRHLPGRAWPEHGGRYRLRHRHKRSG